MIPNNVSCHVLLLCCFFFSLCHEVKILGTFCRTQFSSLLLRVLFAPDADPSVSCPYTRGCRVGCVALGSSRKVLGAPGCCSPHLLVPGMKFLMPTSEDRKQRLSFVMLMWQTQGMTYFPSTMKCRMVLTPLCSVFPV